MNIDLGIRELIYETLNHYIKDSLTKKTQKRISWFIEKTVYFFAIIGPIMTIPQVYKIWAFQTAAGLSLITWSAYILISIFWLLLGIFTKNKPIMLANFFWVLIHISIITGIVLYG
jgi:uncharacterized protein with PQ loop repeat